MITPHLKSFDATDIGDVRGWDPESEEVFYWLTLQIGWAEGTASDTYTVAVATPTGLRRPKGGWRCKPIVVSPYSWESVVAEVDARLKACSGHSWLHVQEQLRTEFWWEYEG